MKRLTHLSLFSGIGGLDLAAERAGLQTVGQCEFADYPYQVLCRHWPAVPKWRDIRTLTRRDFRERTGLRTVDVLSGGFPCQPFSVAGKRRGAEDDRFLWPEMLRVIKELRPTWVVGENVAGIVNMALDQVLSDLEAQNYETRAFVIPACGVDAPHRRDRVAIVAWNNDGKPNRRKPLAEIPGAAERQNAEPGGVCYDVADADQPGIQGRQEAGDAESQREIGIKHIMRRSECDNVCYTASEGLFSTAQPGVYREEESAGTRNEEPERSGWWPAEPDVGRVAHGVSHRVDRLKCLGNAVVPAQFYPIFKGIMEVELHGR